jgi:hypothetical protein
MLGTGERRSASFPASSAAATGSDRRSSRRRWPRGLHGARRAVAAHALHVGIDDDVSFTSLPWDRDVHARRRDTVTALFYGLGSDGTVGANKNSIKIIGDETDLLRAGLLRLRLEEVRLHYRLAPALRPRADPIDLPDRRGAVRGVPPVGPAHAARRAAHAPTRRDGS